MSLYYFLHTELIPWVDVSRPERQAFLEQLLAENPVNDENCGLSEEEVAELQKRIKEWEELADLYSEAKQLTSERMREAALAALPPLGECPAFPDDPNAIDEDDSIGNSVLHWLVACYQSATACCGDGVYSGHRRYTSATALIHRGIMHFAAQCCENTDDIEDAIPEIGHVVEAIDRMDSHGWDTSPTGILSFLWDWYAEDYPDVPFPQSAAVLANNDGEDDED